MKDAVAIVRLQPRTEPKKGHQKAKRQKHKNNVPGASLFRGQVVEKARKSSQPARRNSKGCCKKNTDKQPVEYEIEGRLEEEWCNVVKVEFRGAEEDASARNKEWAIDKR